MEEGIEVDSVIIKYQEKQFSWWWTHHFHAWLWYEVDPQLFKRILRFSINTVHIVYGHAGGLYNTPKFIYSLDDFINAIQPRQKLTIMTLSKPPYWYLIKVNDVMVEIMKYDAVWSWQNCIRIKSSRQVSLY